MNKELKMELVWGYFNYVPSFSHFAVLYFVVLAWRSEFSKKIILATNYGHLKKIKPTKVFTLHAWEYCAVVPVTEDKLVSLLECGLSAKDRGATENPVSDLELNLNKTATKAIVFY